ncbi:MAG: PadR family transcriptional regulator [Pseudomonadota bacterium]
MNVRTLCLAILHHREATGYEIRKLSTEGAYAYFVDASFGSIYPALAKLEDDGLVSCRMEQQVGKPPRKVYSINEKGRAELRANLQEPPKRDTYKSEFLMIGMCAELIDPEDMARAFDHHTEQVRGEVQHMEELSAAMPDGPGNWMQAFGHSCLNHHLQWLMDNRDMIVASAGSSKLDATQLPPALDGVQAAETDEVA